LFKGKRKTNIYERSKMKRDQQQKKMRKIKQKLEK
jgi:hypothetical protein